MITLREAAKELRVCYNTMLKYVSSGAIHAVKIGRTYRVSEEEIERVKKEGVSISHIDVERHLPHSRDLSHE